jgi:hypothetical protein
MIIYGIYLYTIVGHMREILMCYISTKESGPKNVL